MPGQRCEPSEGDDGHYHPAIVARKSWKSTTAFRLNLEQEINGRDGFNSITHELELWRCVPGVNESHVVVQHDALECVQPAGIQPAKRRRPSALPRVRCAMLGQP